MPDDDETDQLLRLVFARYPSLEPKADQTDYVGEFRRGLLALLHGAPCRAELRMGADVLVGARGSSHPDRRRRHHFTLRDRAVAGRNARAHCVIGFKQAQSFDPHSIDVESATGFWILGPCYRLCTLMLSVPTPRLNGATMLL